MNTCFARKDTGNLSQCLGMEVHRDAPRLYLTQTKYITCLLKKFGYENLKSSLTPMAVGKLISKIEGQVMKDPTLYRSAIGGLQYLAYTRSDVTYSVNRMSQFLQTPTYAH